MSQRKYESEDAFVGTGEEGTGEDYGAGVFGKGGGVCGHLTFRWWVI